MSSRHVTSARERPRCTLPAPPPHATVPFFFFSWLVGDGATLQRVSLWEVGFDRYALGGAAWRAGSGWRQPLPRACALVPLGDPGGRAPRAGNGRLRCVTRQRIRGKASVTRPRWILPTVDQGGILGRDFQNRFGLPESIPIQERGNRMLPFLSEFWKVLLIFSRVSLELGIFVGVVSLRQPHGAGIAADSVATRSALLSRFLCSWNG